MGKKAAIRPPGAAFKPGPASSSSGWRGIAVAVAVAVIGVGCATWPSPPASAPATASNTATSAAVTPPAIDPAARHFWELRGIGGALGRYDAPAGCKDLYPSQCRGYGEAECMRNPGWMIVHCPVTCRACDLRSPKARCTRDFLNVTAAPAYAPGDMDTMFGALTSDAAFARFSPTVHSRDPWIVTLDNFLTDAEVDGLVHAKGLDFVRSTDTGAYDETTGATNKIVSAHRTSSNAWCTGECENAPSTQAVHAKIADIVGIPPDHWENLQVLHYEPGQYYKAHHDYIESDNLSPAGPRVLTFFLYLSDVDEGGETCFGKLDICVKPKRGRALLWPSVRDGDLLAQDPRTNHQAQPVTKGVKLAANAWVHLHNFRVPNHWGCTGVFDTLDDSNIETK